MTSYGQTKRSLDKHSLAPKKRFGQNFLVHRQTAEAIVNVGNIKPTDTILEVGVGLGALTQPLAAQAEKVVGLEVDSGIIRFHQEENDLPDNVALHHQDVLTADFSWLQEQCNGRLKIMANLPYSISNPFIFKMIENRHLINWATIMLQKEVAERLMAVPKTKAYGIPTVLLQSCATVSKLMTLKPAEFHPRPKVDSVVIRIDFNQSENISAEGEPYDYSIFQRIVRTTFNQRRKTILNTLSGSGFFLMEGIHDKAENKQYTEKAIISSGIEPSLRPEVLKLDDFIQLALAFERHIRIIPTE